MIWSLAVILGVLLWASGCGDDKIDKEDARILEGKSFEAQQKADRRSWAIVDLQHEEIIL